MDISTGVFTARTDGVYAFSFHANTVRGAIESYLLVPRTMVAKITPHVYRSKVTTVSF